MKKRTILTVIFGVIGLTAYLIYFDNSATNKVTFSKATTSTIIDTLLQKNGFVIIGKTGNVFKFSHKKDSLKYENFHLVTTFNDTVVLAKFEDDSIEIYKKLNVNYSFDSYKTAVYKGVLKDPDFKTNPDAKFFITRIKEGCKEGVNFAGHYTLIYWGCGTACQYGVVVDRKTGEIFSDYISSLGSEFRVDSELIILNAELENKDSKYIELNHFTRVKIKVWKENQFKSLARN